VSFLNSKISAAVLVSAGVLGLASCSDKDPEQAKSEHNRTVTVKQGQAGGVAEDTFNLTTTVTEIDKANRLITLADPDGGKATYRAGPQIRNFDQLKVGDKVNATFTEKMTIFVKGEGEDPRTTHASAIATAPKGAKPGAMVSQSYEIVATIRSLDTTNRIATLAFSDGQTRNVRVRPDVDMARYNVGDTVVIQVNSNLSVVVESP